MRGFQDEVVAVDDGEQGAPGPRSRLTRPRAIPTVSASSRMFRVGFVASITFKADRSAALAPPAVLSEYSIKGPQQTAT